MVRTFSLSFAAPVETAASGRGGAAESQSERQNAVSDFFPNAHNENSCHDRCACNLAVSETVILLPLTPPQLLVDVSIAMERERQQNNSLANG